MSIRNLLWMSLLALVALAGGAAAQDAGPCPECDEDGEPDDSWYASYDTGVITDDGGVVEDVDVSTGENEHGKFTWFQYCLQFFDMLGNEIAIMYEVFASEDGTDVDAKARVNGEEVDLEDTLVGDLDDQTWNAMEDAGLEMPDAPVGHEDLPDLGELQSVDECLYLTDGAEAELAADATASCEVTL